MYSLSLESCKQLFCKIEIELKIEFLQNEMKNKSINDENREKSER